MKAIYLVGIFIFVIALPWSNGQISADFFTSNQEACGSLQTTFFDQSTSNTSIISWAWDLGGNTSSQQNPGAIFASPGSYTICLTVTDVDGNTDTECKEAYITIHPNPVANFTANVNEGCAPIQVRYTDLSTSENSEIVSWLWGIGGTAGVIDTEDPAQIIQTWYVTGGNFTASLTVEDNFGCTNTVTQNNFINVFQIPEPDITSQLLSSCQLPWEVQFTNNNADSSVEYIWDFGNGSMFEGETPPVVEYTEIGVYDVTIYMVSGDCRDTLNLNGYIDTDVTALFSYEPNLTCQNSAIQFTDQSVISADSVLWNFGDGNVSKDDNPNHSYMDSGCYEVTLIRFAQECSDTAVVSCIEILPTPEVEVQIDNQFNCTLPTLVTLTASSSVSGNFTWAFMNGSANITADTNNVPILIEEYGEYTVNMTFTDSVGCSYEEYAIPIDILPFEANLPVQGPSGCAPLTVTLVDSVFSPVEIVRWDWSIENGLFSSTSSTPNFTIQDTGRYDVTLIVENINGCIDTVVVEDYIKVGMLPEVDFVANPLESCLDVAKQFTDLSSDYVDEWEWKFESFTFSNEQNPFETFGFPGTFDIVLTAAHNGCSDSLRIEDYITILEPVSSKDFEYNCEDPYSVNVINTSFGYDSLSWTLYLSDTDSLITSDTIFGTYTFSDRGKYLLKLYTTNFETGCEHESIDTIHIVDPIASYTLDTLRGCAPLEIQLGDFSQDAFSYEYLTDAGTIDSIFSSEPTITFTEGGVINGPLLIITDIHECKDSFQLMDSVIVNRLDAAVEYPSVVCVPDEVDLIEQSVDVLGNKIKWEWKIANGLFQSSSQDTSIYLDSVGVYDLSFKVEDDWGCEDSLYIPSAINAVEIVPDFTSDTLGCTTAPISFTAMGDNGFVDSYEWDFGDGNSSVEQNPEHKYAQEGVYNVCLTMGDSRGCFRTICKDEIVTIIDPDANFTGDPIFATCPPLLTNFENLSEDAIAYTWDFGDNSGRSLNDSPSHVYTSPGTYDVTLIAQSTSKCFDTLIIEDFVRLEGPSGEFTFELSSVCVPIRVDLFAQSDGYYSYTWDYGNGVLDSVAGLIITDTTSFTYTETGIFTPKLIITDSIGCSRSFAGDPIAVNEVELDFLKTTDPLCGPPLDVHVDNISSGTTDAVTYSWYVEGPQEFTSSDSSPVFSITENGVYSVNLIAAYDLCIDTLTKHDFLEIAAIPDVAFEIVTDAFCADVNAQFINTSSVSYGEFAEWHWEFGDGNSSSVENPIHQYTGEESRTITLTGITDKGCEASFTTSFDVLPSMPVDAGDDQLICVGDEIELNGQVENLLENGTVYWESNPTLSCLDCLNPVASPLFTSQYFLVSIHPNGCEARDTIEVTVVPIPGPELTLAGDSIICLGTESTIIVEDFNPAYSYFWNQDVPGQDCYEDCEVVNVSPEEETTYFVTVINEFGCEESDSVTIEVESSFVEFIPDVKGICVGESTTLHVLAGNNPQWDFDPDISCLTCSEIEVTPDQNKKYYLSIESDIGCMYYDSVEVLVIPDNFLSAGSDEEICLGESIMLNASGIGDVQWYPEEIIENSTSFSTRATPNASGFIGLEATFDECTQLDSFYVEVHTHAEITAIGDSICTGGTGILRAEGKIDSYRWKLDDETLLNQDLEASAETTKFYKVIGEYRSCVPDTAEAMLFVHPIIEYALPEDFYIIHLNDQVALKPEFDNSRNYLFEWFPETGLDCADCPDPIISGIMENMEYELLVEDEDSGCMQAYEISVRFQNECTQNIFHLPNIFSPNNDGDNDEFLLTTSNPEEFISMSVFDRWGNLLFSSNDINEGWKGTMGGATRVQPGVYVYRIELICPFTTENIAILGDITVIY
ncbi:MAG: PKD domain-containing protein [Bacteroidota bacterium]